MYKTVFLHTKIPGQRNADRGLVLDIQVHLDVLPPVDAAGGAVRVKILLRVLPGHGEGGEFLETQFLPSFIAACAGRYSDRLFGTTAPYPAKQFAYHPTDDFTPFLTIHIDYETAKAYRNDMGYYLRPNQWEDITIYIYL